MALCRVLAERGANVLAACRTTSPALAKLGLEVVEGVDVTDDAGIAHLQVAVGKREVELLINNAGVMEQTPLETFSVEAIRRQFEINALGPLRVTAALRKHLVKGAKVGLITSRMGSIDDNSSGGY